MEERYANVGPGPVAAARGRRIEAAQRSDAALPLGLGGLVIVIGSFLSWASGPAAKVASDINGASFADGRIVMAIGFALLAMALYMGTARREGHWYDADLLGLALSTMAVVIIVAFWVDLPDGRSVDAGLYVALVGSLIAMVGSLVALIRSRRDRSYEAQADPIRRDAAA